MTSEKTAKKSVHIPNLRRSKFIAKHNDEIVVVSTRLHKLDQKISQLFNDKIPSDLEITFRDRQFNPARGYIVLLCCWILFNINYVYPLLFEEVQPTLGEFATLIFYNLLTITFFVAVKGIKIGITKSRSILEVPGRLILETSEQQFLWEFGPVLATCVFLFGQILTVDIYRFLDRDYWTTATLIPTFFLGLLVIIQIMITFDITRKLEHTYRDIRLLEGRKKKIDDEKATKLLLKLFKKNNLTEKDQKNYLHKIQSKLEQEYSIIDILGFRAILATILTLVIPMPIVFIISNYMFEQLAPVFLGENFSDLLAIITTSIIIGAITFLFKPDGTYCNKILSPNIFPLRTLTYDIVYKEIVPTQLERTKQRIIAYILKGSQIFGRLISVYLLGYGFVSIFTAIIFSSCYDELQAIIIIVFGVIISLSTLDFQRKALHGWLTKINDEITQLDSQIKKKTNRTSKDIVELLKVL